MECSKDIDENDKDKEKSYTEGLNGVSSPKEMECSEDLAEEKENKKRRPEDNEERLMTRKSMLQYLSTNERVFFKSYKEDEEELDKQQKIDIAEELLDRDYGLFLAKFGNHLLKEHLCYFENRSDDESLIVDLYLKQLCTRLEQQNKNHEAIKAKSKPSDEEMDVTLELSSGEKSRLELRNELLDYLSLSKDAHFKSQQVGETDLNKEEKRDIAEALLDRSASLFLSRFGTHLLEEQLAYFDQTGCEESYEVEFHLKQLRKTHCKVVSEVGIKNRRFEALKKMVGEGSYFCETEMRNRNPLLYEQLVGRFLTTDERSERLNNIDTTNITFVNLLLEQMDREAVKKLRKEQEEAEDGAMEEEEDETYDEQMEEDDDSEEDNDLDKTLWGEELTDGEALLSKKKHIKKEEKKIQEKRNEEEDIPELSDAEKSLLMDEFRSNMFSSFLQGKDTDFDYSQVDYNSDYDDLEAQGQDEEEKYFDEESSQGASSHKVSDEEDLLDQYMDRLKPEPTPQQLAEKLQTLGHGET